MNLRIRKIVSGTWIVVFIFLGITIPAFAGSEESNIFKMGLMSFFDGGDEEQG